MSDASAPFVSIIMPVRNEGDFIERSLGAVLAQGYPNHQLEVLVADGMSIDNTRQLVEQLAAASDIPVTIVDNPGLFVSQGFNAAFRRSRGEIIVRVDGHTLVEMDYVRQCVATLKRTEADNVGGRMDAVGQGAFGEAVALATCSPFGVGGARFHYSQKEELVDTVYMGAWYRKIFERIGLFDEELIRNQDDEFNYRLRAAGGKVLLNPRIRSKYYNRGNLPSLTRQYYQYGVYKVRVMQKHPQQMRPRQFAPVLLVSGVLGGALLSLLWAWVMPFWIVGLLAYAAANLLASVYIARREGQQHFLRLPVVFAALHFGYGLGFLRGLVKFRSYWGKTRNQVEIINEGQT